MDIVVRLAVKNDANRLSVLNNKWQRENVSLQNQQNCGFLSAAFSANDFLQIIEIQEIVVAEDQDEIVGYWMLNNIIDTTKFKLGKAMVQKFKNEQIIAKDTHVGLGAQVVIDYLYQHKGLSSKMFNLLKSHVSQHYQVLYSSISKNNDNSLKQNLPLGWKVIGEDENCYFVLCNIVNN